MNHAELTIDSDFQSRSGGRAMSNTCRSMRLSGPFDRHSRECSERRSEQSDPADKYPAAVAGAEVNAHTAVGPFRLHRAGHLHETKEIPAVNIRPSNREIRGIRLARQQQANLLDIISMGGEQGIREQRPHMPFAIEQLRDVSVECHRRVLIQIAWRPGPSSISDVATGDPVADQIDADAADAEAGGRRRHSIRHVLKRRPQIHVITVVAVDVQAWIQPYARRIRARGDVGARFRLRADPRREDSRTEVSALPWTGIAGPRHRISKLQLRRS